MERRIVLCARFATAYELAIAAECASEIAGTVTRADLFSAFIRRRLSRVSSPAYDSRLTAATRPGHGRQSLDLAAA